LQEQFYGVHQPFGIDLPEMYRGVFPFVGLQILVVFLIILFPPLDKR